MNVIHGLEGVDPPLTQCVLTVGNFDGVHRAHQQILAQAGLFAARTRGPVVVLTFEPHPLSVVAPDRAPARLSTLDEKLHDLALSGAQTIVVARSEPALLSLEPEAFVREIVLHKFHPTHVVEGPSFGFGRGRRGTPELLERVAGESGCKVHIVQSVTLQMGDGDTLLVSSSLIRKLITQGNVRRAALCLGRPYALSGRVVQAQGRGRGLGFPTANIPIPNKLIPPDGVYAGRATIDDRSRPCGISIGHTPTFGGSKRQIEAHLLDFDADIQDQFIRIEFERFLREQRTFDSPDELKAQLQVDLDEVRREVDPSVSEPDAEQRISG